MFDEFKNEQPVAIKLLENTLIKDNNVHAYLFETNNYYRSNELIKTFIKALLCPNHGGDNCNICQSIDAGEHIEVKNIYADGTTIKKDQILELQDDFSKKSFVGNKRIYVIHNAEKMNESSSNAILKFLEEPAINVIAILITENIYRIYKTISSRTQIISLNGIKEKSYDYISKIVNMYNINIEKEKVEEVSEIAIEYINYYENNKMEIFVHSKDMFLDNISEKELIVLSFRIMILYYRDVINYLYGRKLDVFISKENEIKRIANKNNVAVIAKKISFLLDGINRKQYNANNALLMDNLVLRMEEIG